MGIVKFSIWPDIPSKYIEEFYVIVSVIVMGIFSERLTDTSCQDFSLWFLEFFQLWLKLLRKMSYWIWIVLFSRSGLPFFYLCHVCLLNASWVLFLKKKSVHCILWVYAHYPKEQNKKKCLVEVSYICKNFFRAQRVFVLSLQTLKLV